MPNRMWVGWSGFAASAAFVVVQATYLVIVGTQLIRPAAWDLSIALLVLSGVTTISLSAQNRIVRALVRRIDLVERRSIMRAAGGDADDDPRPPLRIVR
ncbi:hypothetical protein [Amycolatopsis jiangsuensis]|uniref:Uncharacterized protein n=1 Tax=Amycolatopsis jiangsuensis TaxID=1181879 RepID=A0A840J8Q0_9PSEU|nr:hypothetical protein [Amycolatopsis jiangsuensis]MBB4689792.1 hypothetical protein [Amycolatopsis jiangsuensis]